MTTPAEEKIAALKRQLDSALANEARWSRLNAEERNEATAAARKVRMEQFRHDVEKAAAEAGDVLTVDEIEARSAQLRSTHFSGLRRNYLQSIASDPE